MSCCVSIGNTCSYLLDKYASLNASLVFGTIEDTLWCFSDILSSVGCALSHSYQRHTTQLVWRWGDYIFDLNRLYSSGDNMTDVVRTTENSRFENFYSQSRGYRHFSIYSSPLLSALTKLSLQCHSIQAYVNWNCIKLPFAQPHFGNYIYTTTSYTFPWLLCHVTKKSANGEGSRANNWCPPV